MFDPNQLKIFLMAVECMNFSTAARKLHLSQPSVTQNIRSLENQVGEKLFLRSGRHLQLSEAGVTLLPLARQLVSMNTRAMEVLESSRGQIAGKLMIACSTTPGKYILPVILADFMRLHPLVEVSCQVMNRQYALEMLEQEKVHFAFSSSIDELGPNFEFRKFFSDPIRLVVPLDHPWAERGEIRLEDLLDERFVLREETAGTYKVVKTALAQQGYNIYDLKVVLTLGNSEAILIAIQQGVGVGFVTQTVLSQLCDVRVVPVQIAGVEFKQDIYMCRHRMSAKSGVQAAFWDYISNISPDVLARVGYYISQVRQQES